MLFVIPAFLLYLLAISDKKRTYFGGKMSLKHGLFTGLSITAIVSVIASLSQVFIHTVITPNFFENSIDYAVDQGLGAADAKAIYNLLSYTILSLFITAIAGVVLTVIASLILRNRK